MTVLGKLVASETDIGDYVTYVFEVLDEEYRKEFKYVMLVRWPNWNSRSLELGEIGYVEFKEIRAGIDKWYDGNTFIPYNYNNIQFIKFIPKAEPKSYKYEILINLKFIYYDYSLNEQHSKGEASGCN